jgi:thioredoxin 1
MAEIQSVNENNFQDEVMDSELPVLVDFWAAWCGYCTQLTPIFEELATEMAGQVKFVKVNVDENRSLAQKQDVQGLPTMILFKNGQAAEKLTGFMPKVNIAAKIKQHR